MARRGVPELSGQGRGAEWGAERHGANRKISRSQDGTWRVPISNLPQLRSCEGSGWCGWRGGDLQSPRQKALEHSNVDTILRLPCPFEDLVSSRRRHLPLKDLML